MTDRLIVEDVHFARGETPILRGVDLRHEAGQVLTLLGPSGSGKTTLLWIMAGLLTPERGRVSFGSADGSRPSVGFVFQDGGLWEHLSVRTHLELVLHGRGLSRQRRRARVDAVLDGVGLGRHVGRRPGELSGGERQRLALARALVIEPRWLLLDEPTSQLDGPTRQDMVDLLDQHLRRCALGPDASSSAGVILATHQVDLALRLSDRIAVLIDGRVAQVDTPKIVYDSPANLAVARLTGPAFELAGDVWDGVMKASNVPVLSGLSPSLTGPQRIILRPQQVAFELDDCGPATIKACRFAGGVWHLNVNVDGCDPSPIAASPTAVDAGARGRLVLTGRQSRPVVSPGA